MSKEKKDDLFNEENIPASNWAKFEKVGDKFSGVVEDINIKKGSDGFRDQKVFALKQEDGSVINVGISVDKTFIIQRTNKVRAGDLLGFEFQKEIPATTKGHHPAKSIIPYIKYLPDGDAVREFEKTKKEFMPE